MKGLVLFEESHQFRQTRKILRNDGINCHFTAGGSFASLRPDELFSLIPELDSIVRFEGEDTLPELVNCLITGSDWKSIRSIAFRENGKTMLTPLRPLENDIDRFPFPIGDHWRNSPAARNMLQSSGSRGCLNDCSFCNTREFYRHTRRTIEKDQEARSGSK